jgi:uncharacterized phage infection (PIP) family protein YhgE
MSSSKSFGVRMPLEMYLKMVMVCTKNGISQTDLVLYSLNRVGLFSDEFKLGGEVEEKIVYRNEPELLEEITRLRQNTNGYFKQWQEQTNQNEKLKQKLVKAQTGLCKATDELNKASMLFGNPKEQLDAYFELNELAVELSDEEL